MNHNACLNMVKQQLRTGDVLNDSILALYDEIPRSAFVPEGMRDFAYSDMQISYGIGQRMMTPLEEGKILQALGLQGHETVLEVGTGTGFFAALLSRLSKKVITIEYDKGLTQAAERKLHQYQCHNVECYTGDAYRGWLEKAPYDVVIFTGALEDITDIQRLQVFPGGKLIAILGQAPVMQCILFSLDHNNHWTQKSLYDTCLPPLINAFKVNAFVF